MDHQGLKVYKVYIIDDPVLFYSKVNFGQNCSYCLYQTNSEVSVYRTISPLVFSSPESLGSQGELIVYPSSVRRRRCHPLFTMLKIFSETAGPIKAKFYVEPPWVGGTIFCSPHLGHMTKMAATPIYGKNPSKIFFSRTGGPIFTKLGM